MRISTLQFYHNYSKDISKKQENISRIQDQISSGLKNNLNPLDKFKQLLFKSKIEEQKQFQENISYAKNKLESEENIMGSINTILDDTKELIIKNTPILNSVDKEIFLNQIKNTKEQLLNLANFKDHEEYIFSGNNTNIPAFDSQLNYQGTSQFRSVEISENNYIIMGDSGSDVFNNIFNNFTNLETSITNNSSLEEHLKNIENDSENNNIILAKIGSKQNTLEFIKNNNQNLLDSQNKSLSDVQDSDMTENIISLNKESLTIQAIQKSYLQIQSLSLFNYI